MKKYYFRVSGQNHIQKCKRQNSLKNAYILNISNMNILMLLQKILWISIMNYVVDGDGGGSDGSDNGSNGSDGAGDDGSDNGSDGGSDDKDSWKSDPEKKDTPDDKFKRWKISQAKKEAAKKVVDGDDSDDKKGSKKTDEDFEAYFEEKFNEKLKSLWLEKLNKIDEFESKFEKDEFFNQFKEAGKDFAEYWLSIDPSKWGEVLADIEANWFTPAQLILLANADTIIWKLKGLPRSPMKVDTWSKVKTDGTKMDMKDRLAVIKEKFWISN